METSIQKLDDYTDEATKTMLQKLVEKKWKFDLLTKRHLFIMWLTIFLTFIYTYWLYKQIAVPYAHSFAVMFSVFIQEKNNLYAMAIIIGSFGFMNVLKQKKDKAEKEFHALRCEIIDKSKDLWKKEEEWKNRHKVFDMMKKLYDINLFHESK
ncbi:YpbF family protein [Niallia sp. 03133]|uniref:YpbF family protein n=1 Tax=Niallia sp. 03133 TaxID=3458060 RepID=UPI004044EE42